MLNQFTGIAKVLNKDVSFNPILGFNVINFKLQLCNKETENEYIFHGTMFRAVYDGENRKKFNKYDTIEIDDILAFKGHFTTYGDMVMTIDSLKVV